MQTFIKILAGTMMDFAREDIHKYGCLMELKNTLQDLCKESASLKDVYIALYYAKDFSIIRNIDKASILIDLCQNTPTEQEAEQVIERRLQSALLPVDKLFVTGEARLMSSVDHLAEALISQDDLVKENK